MRTQNEINNSTISATKAYSSTVERPEKPLQVQFIKDQFTPSETRDVITGLVKSNIDFYKMQSLSQWVRDHSSTGESCDKKVDSLKLLQMQLDEIINQAKEKGCNITIDGTLNITFDSQN